MGSVLNDKEGLRRSFTNGERKTKEAILPSLLCVIIFLLHPIHFLFLYKVCWWWVFFFLPLQLNVEVTSYKGRVSTKTKRGRNIN